ncbi:PREDICTED: calpain-9-like [Branchiostoma belcheri]|uniref:Calpain-9-like n=1 Tax=Branchiostoma belcheri TaxID=7741 RepID=A0A6P4ZI05_BRABE|nr:PREDICTED: calpain-9-like [Branchiostoma belcheri]
MGCGASAPPRRDYWAPNAVHGNKPQGRSTVPGGWAPPPPGYAPNQGSVQYVTYQHRNYPPPPQWQHAGIAPPTGPPQGRFGRKPPHVPFPNFVSPRPPRGRKPVDHGDSTFGHRQPQQKLRPPPRRTKDVQLFKPRPSRPRPTPTRPPPSPTRPRPHAGVKPPPDRADSPPVPHRQPEPKPPTPKPPTPKPPTPPPVHVEAATEEMRFAIQSCLDSGIPWDDPDFPATPKSIDHKGKDGKDIEWKRPKEMSDNPRLLVHGVSTDDVKQGTLGDCWFLSACASIARESQLMAKVIPKDQYLWRGEGRYAGVAHFRFWRFGEWEDVYVDDKLPTRWSNLTYARCSDKNEFWLPLIEKAYAKLNGSYSSLDRGQTTVALTDLTGGICERFKTGFQEAAVLYQAMLKAQKRGSFMTCSTHSTFEEGHDSGLVSGHAYTITGVSKIRSSGKTHRLIKIRNPWGRQEWKGAWSDGSPEWQGVSEAVKQRLYHENKDDGEFWMEYDDWSEFYREVTIASLAEHETVRTGPKSKWDVAQEIGEWVKGETAGGSVGYQKTYWKNPQYLFTLSSEDDFDPEEDDEEDRGTCSVLIGLMQENKQFKGKFTHIGFQVYEVSSPDRELKLSKRQLGQSSPVFRTLSYYNTREVTLRIQMDPGTYVIVPTTHEPKIEGPFLLRVLTEKPTQLRELG